MHLDVRFSASPLGVSQVGIVVPRHQHSAVDRNRVKRRLRELVRTVLLPALRDERVAVSIRSRREAYDADFAALRRDIETVATKLATTRETGE